MEHYLKAHSGVSKQRSSCADKRCINSLLQHRMVIESTETVSSCCFWPAQGLAAV